MLLCFIERLKQIWQHHSCIFYILVLGLEIAPSEMKHGEMLESLNYKHCIGKHVSVIVVPLWGK